MPTPVSEMTRCLRDEPAGGEAIQVPRSALSYASPAMPRAQRWFLFAIEQLAGIRRAERIYATWRQSNPATSRRPMNDLLAACEMSLRIAAPHWPLERTEARGLIIVANHPFGIPDGVAILALAEQLNRPVRILINNDLLRVPEMRRMALPIDFAETKAAVRTNLASRREALACLARGETVVIFPGGGIATAPHPFGAAEELPWKLFTAKLIHLSGADVLPVYFCGQNSPLFHAASRVSLFLRLSLILPEAVRRLGHPIEARVGLLLRYEELAPLSDRHLLTRYLYERVMALGRRRRRPAASQFARGGKLPSETPVAG